MCWSVEASAALVVAGTAATGVARHRKLPLGIWVTLGYFTAMEALQVAGYLVVDQCGTPENKAITMLSYLHIVFQPLFINAFAMELVPEPVRVRARMWIFGFCALSSVVMLAQVLPWAPLGNCTPGAPLCGQNYCTASGNWHIAWHIPYNGLLVPVDQMIGMQAGFPSYMLAVFLLPLIYGAWRFVLLHAVTGPILAWSLTSNPNEMPAVWCLFSIAILCISLSPLIRRSMTSRSWWGVPV